MMIIWPWVKKGYLKNPTGKRKNRLKTVVPKGWHLFDPLRHLDDFDDHLDETATNKKAESYCRTAATEDWHLGRYGEIRVG